MKRRGNCCLSGDGRCKTLGHNVKYLTHSCLDKETDKITAMSLIQVSEVDNSNQMEKVLLKHFRCSKDENIMLTQIRGCLFENCTPSLWSLLIFAWRTFSR